MYTTDRPLAPARNPRQTGITDYIPLLRYLASALDWAIRTPAAKFRRSLSMHKRWVKNTESTVPCEIANYIHAHLESLITRGYFKGGSDGMLSSCVNELQAVEARLVHIRNTRLAFAYQAHLRICTWLYLILFPLTNYESLGQWVILAEAVIAFILLGMLDIAREV
jgi:putative membrane protein